MARRMAVHIDTPRSSSWGILGSTITAIWRWSYTISPSVRRCGRITPFPPARRYESGDVVSQRDRQLESAGLGSRPTIARRSLQGFTLGRVFLPATTRTFRFQRAVREG